MNAISRSFEGVLADAARHPGFLLGVVASADGLPMARRLPVDVDPLRFSAAASVLVSTAQQALHFVGAGPAEAVVVKGRRALVVSAPAGPEAGVLLIFREGVDMAQALRLLEEAARRVERLVKEM